MLRSRSRQHSLVKKHLITINYQQSQNLDLTFVYHLLSKYDFRSCVRHSVTLISYLWSFLLTVLKSTSYHKFGSKKTKVSLRSTYLSRPDAFSVIRCIRNKREFLFSECFRFPFFQTPVIEENIVETIKIYETK